MTAYTQFVSALAALPVSGVVTRLAYPPASINASDLPMLFVQMPRGNDAPIVFDAAVTWPRLRADVVIVVEPVGQSRTAESFSLSVAMMDALSAVLPAADLGLTRPEWTIRQDNVEIAGNVYWAVVAEVEVRG